MRTPTQVSYFLPNEVCQPNPTRAPVKSRFQVAVLPRELPSSNLSHAKASRPRRKVRHPVPRLPSNLCREHPMDRRVCDWSRGPRLFAGAGETIRCIQILQFQTKDQATQLERPDCEGRQHPPSSGYLEAICQPNLEYMRDPIERFTTVGIQTKGGMHREVDAAFCATGANTDLVPRCPSSQEASTSARLGDLATIPASRKHPWALQHRTSRTSCVFTARKLVM